MTDPLALLTSHRILFHSFRFDILNEITYWTLVSATHFIKTLDSSCLSIDPSEFQKKMEANDPSKVAKEETSHREMMSKSQSYPSFNDLISFDSTTNLFDQASSTPGVYKFANYTVDELRVGDLAQLLEEYKKLIQENTFLRGQIKR
jgi:hypothetical protein